MASILDILIQVLNIDCGIAQCYYANEIEAMFYIFFFPTIFIILFIYILTSFIFRGGGKVRGLKLMIAIGAYAFIVFEGMFTMFVGLSRLWWLLTIILVGLFAFIRFLFRGGEGEGSKGGMPGVGGGILKRLAHGISEEHIEQPARKLLDLESSEDRINKEGFKKLRKLMEKVNYNVTNLNPDDRGAFNELCRILQIDSIKLFSGKKADEVKKMFKKAED